MKSSFSRLNTGALPIGRRRLRLAAIALLLIAGVTVALGAGKSAPSRTEAPLIGEMLVTATRLG
jgi:hypothetical protein